jgi:hypothetical protein
MTLRQAARGPAAILASISLATGALAPQAASAQTCFRGRPAPTCASFFLTEAEVGVMVAPEAGGRLGVDVGFMRNIGTRSAIGGTIAAGYTFVDGYNDFGYISLRPRYRYWLSHTTSIDVGPGLQWTPNGDTRIEARVAFTYRDLVGGWTELHHDVERSSPVTWLVGAKAGAQAGIITYIAGALTLGVLALMLGASGS